VWVTRLWRESDDRRLLEGKNAKGVALFRRFQTIVEACGPSEAAVSRTVVFFGASASSRAASSTDAG
jgi:hypothetical protein